MAEQQVSPGSDFLKAHMDAGVTGGCSSKLQVEECPSEEIISSDEVTES